MSALTDRLLGSAILSARSYEEVETDRSANWQAIGIVILSSLSAAVGAGLTKLTDLAVVLVFVLSTWIIWVLLTLFIGTKLLPGNQTVADFGQVLRTTGFSTTPGILRALGFLPGIGVWIFGAATVWMLFAFAVAIRQALDYTSTRRALAVCFLGWLIHGVLLFGFLLTAY